MAHYRDANPEESDGAAGGDFTTRAVAWPGLVLLVAAALAVLSMIGCGGNDGGAGGEVGEQDRPGEQAGGGKVESGGAAPGEKRKSREEAGKQGDAAKRKTAPEREVKLTDAGKKRADKAESYISRLKDTAADAGSTSTGQMAAAWADLYTWCSQNGLPGAAARCWYQARRAGSMDDATRQKLGLTESVEGVAVTSEQKKFLQRLRPRVEVIDVTGYGRGTELTLPDGSTTELSFAEPINFQVESGLVQMQYERETGAVSSTLPVTVEALPGFRHVVRLKPRSMAPAAPWQRLVTLHRAYRRWKQSEGAQRQKLLVQGISLRNRRRVEFRAGPEGNLQEIDIGGWLRAVSEEGNPLRVIARDGVVTVDGLVLVRSPGREATRYVYCGTERRKVRFERMGNSNNAQHSAGMYYELERRFSRPMANLLGSMHENVRKQIARSSLEKRRRDIQIRARVREADGEWKGVWEAENWQRKQFLLARSKIRRQLARQRRVARLSIALDRAAELETGDRVENLWANWPRYRQALAQVLAESAGPILDRIRALNTRESGDRDNPRRSRRPGRGEDEGRQRDSSPGYPVDYLALFPADFAIDRVNRDWGRLDSTARVRAVETIGMLDRDSAIERLSDFPAESDDEAVVAAAYRELAELGGEAVRTYLESPGVGEREKAAIVTAQALLGKPEALESLPGSVAGAPDAALDVAAGADNPMAATVLAALEGASGGESEDSPGAEKMTGPGPRSAAPVGSGDNSREEEDKQEEGPTVVHALTRLADVHAVREILNLGQGDKDVTPGMLRRVTHGALPLLVGPALDKVGDGNTEVAIALGERRPEGTLELLQKDASSGDNPAAGLALAAWGSSAALKAAKGQAGALRVSHLVALYESWNLHGEGDTDRWEWREAVEKGAAADFLEAVAKNGSSGKARLAAVLMARESNQPMSPEALMAFAASGASDAEEDGGEAEKQPESSRAAGPARGPSSLSGRGGRSRSRSHDDRGGPNQQEKEEDKKPWDLSGDPRLRALRLYPDVAGSGLSEGLQEMVRNADEPAVQERAAQMIVEQNLPNAVSILGEMAGAQEADAGTRAAAARALGMTGAEKAGQDLVNLYNKVEEDAVKAGICHGLAELSGRIGAERAVPADARRKLVSQFLEFAAGSDSEAAPSVGLRAAAVRAAAQLDAFDMAHNARVLKSLEQKFGWKAPGEEEQEPEEAEGERESRRDGPSSPGRGGPGRLERDRGDEDEDASGSSHPVELRAAVAEAASVLTGHSKFGALAERAALALRKEDDLADAWQDHALALARMGRKPCLRFLARGVDVLKLETLERIAEMSAEMENLPTSHYMLLAHAAATDEEEEDSRDEETRERESSLRGRGMRESRREPQEESQEQGLLPEPELGEQRRWPRMQWACVELLQGAPEQVVTSALEPGGIGLATNPQVGPMSVVHLSDMAGEFDLTSYLQRFFASQQGDSARRNGLLAARRAGADVSAKLVEALLAGRLRLRSGKRGERRGQRRRRPPRRPGRERRERRRPERRERRERGRLERRARESRRGGEPGEVIRYAARALGSMGQPTMLRRAWRQAPPPIKPAAVEGMAYLPSAQNPLQNMRSLPGSNNPGARRLLNRAATTALQVARIRSSNDNSSGE